MEEMMMVMMKIRTNEPSSPTPHDPPPKPNNIPSASPAWKLYENPFFLSHNTPHHHPHPSLPPSLPHPDSSTEQRQIHRIHLPISARKIAASFWDLTFIKPFMESELELARAQITELKAELELERKSRKKTETLFKNMSKELSDERRERMALERVCEQLAKEVSADKTQINRMKIEMDQERKMLRTAEVIREERVQMKLAEAKILLEEKLSELESSKKAQKVEAKGNPNPNPPLGERLRLVLGEKISMSAGSVKINSMALMQRKGCNPEGENPHIKRGIKGFVEFPKVVRAIGCRSSKHLGTKLECQKAQLKILLKQKGNIRYNGLIAS